MSGLSTHILDTTKGQPAENVSVALEFSQDNNFWEKVNSTQTNTNGRVSNLLPTNFKLQAGFYRLTFNTSSYFHNLGVKGFYPLVTIVIEVIDPAQHYHVPLLLSPFGYATYRGS